MLFSHSVVSNSLRPHGLQHARVLCSWGFSRQGYWSLLPCSLPGDLPNPGLLHCRWILYWLSHQGSYIVKATIFPLVKYVCESWTIKKAEHWRTDAFKLWRWRRLLRIPWTARRSNQSKLKEINPEYSLEELMLKLKLRYFDHLIWRADSLENILMVGKIEGKRRRTLQRMWLDSITYSMDTSLSKLQKTLKDRDKI